MLKLFSNLSCFSEMLQYLYLASFVHICCGQAVTTIDATFPEHIELYSTQRLSCNITGTLTSGVRWIRPDTALVSTCASATNCLPILGYSIPEATATRNVLEIANTTVQDGGVWICRDGASGLPSTGLVIVMKNSSACVINSTSSLDNVKQGSHVTFMVYITQYYCSATALFQLGDANVTLSGTPTGLDDNEGSVTVVLTKSETLDLYMVCGGAAFKQNCHVNLTTDNPTSTATPGGPTTPTAGGMCKDINCNLFFLLLLLLFIPIIGVIIGRSRKKKKPKSNSNVMNTCGEDNKPVSDEVQVNNDKSD